MSTADQTQAAPAGQATQEVGLLDQIFNDQEKKQLDKASRSRNAEEVTRARGYFEEFIRQAVKPGQVVSKDVETTINYWIGEIDKKLSAQLNQILHHEEFQKLEGTWRGLYYLVDQTITSETLKIHVLNVSKRELFKDMTRISGYDRNALWEKVYEREFGTLGGEPYGMLVGDYHFDYSSEDVTLLSKISQVAAAAHAPFIAGASPGMFRLDSYTELSKPYQLKPIFQGPEYAPWRSFRESEEARYVGLTMPRVLGRLPYGKGLKTVDAFNYEEGVDGMNHQNYLWMNAAWAYAARVTSSFFWDGWFCRTRGVEGGGKVEGLPVHTFPTDEGGLAMKCPTEISITDRREMELSDLGFLPLIHCKNTDFAAFIGSQSCQKPKTYFDHDANANAELSTKLNYMLCVSRFSHFLKVMARNKVGKFMEVKDCAKWLNDWISNYVIANPEDAGDELRARHPLREARVDVEEIKGRPGWYRAKAFLRPHYQLEGLHTSISLVANVPNPIGK